MDTNPAPPPMHHGKFIFVIGGPGAGKGTQCSRLSLDLTITHISFGDVQRAELAKPDSRLAHLPNEPDRRGSLADDGTSVQLLQERIESFWAEGERRFLLDGFPRSAGQAAEFERKVGPGLLMLLFDAPAQTREERVVRRGRVSGRAEDNAGGFRRRSARFEWLSPPAIAMFAERGLLRKVDCQRPVEEVYRDVRSIVTLWMGGLDPHLSFDM
ncbi:MAG: uridylate kinase [Lasallia pustulata]|uniref:Uridylate kinase n=1 Tax=Lasallia pustulata TaxID=136370 RepID=A0A5M8PQI0_9LECA|nr:MAG: uridylate kinase [Lasallia pustulata]